MVMEKMMTPRTSQNLENLRMPEQNGVIQDASGKKACCHVATTTTTTTTFNCTVTVTGHPK